MMKAVVQSRYGPPDVLRLEDLAKSAVTDDEVLVRVRAAAVNIGDWYLLRGVPYVMRLVFGLRGPRRRTRDSTSTGKLRQSAETSSNFVVAMRCSAGANAHSPNTRARPRTASCPSRPTSRSSKPRRSAIRVHRLGRHSRSRKSTAGAEGAVNGESGGVGTFAVQIAKSCGANVTAVCSTRNVDLVRSLGGDQVIDYTNEHFAQSAERYDVMLDLVGTSSLSDCKRALTPQGTYVLVGVKDIGRWFGLGRQSKALLLSPFVGQRMRVFVVGTTRTTSLF
jgi:NADPH:quinone reductase-like Zn-dependent oxidoreductase